MNFISIKFSCKTYNGKTRQFGNSDFDETVSGINFVDYRKYSFKR